MFAKILAVSALVACAQAGVFELGHGHHATSYSSLSDAPVTHYASAPVAAHYAAPVAAYHHAPAVVKTIAPVAHYAAPVAAHYAAPVAAYHHVPAVIKTVAPVAAYHHVPTVVKTVAPVAHYAAPIVKSVHQEVYPDTHPQYSYQYGVQDAHTGDVKNQHEVRDGDVVKGYYTLVQPDGVTRTVHYSADSHNGFNAEVEYKGEPIVQKAVVAKTIVAAAPVYKAYHH